MPLALSPSASTIIWAASLNVTFAPLQFRIPVPSPLASTKILAASKVIVPLIPTASPVLLCAIISAKPFTTTELPPEDSIPVAVLLLLTAVILVPPLMATLPFSKAVIPLASPPADTLISALPPICVSEASPPAVPLLSLLLIPIASPDAETALMTASPLTLILPLSQLHKPVALPLSLLALASSVPAKALDTDSLAARALSIDYCRSGYRNQTIIAISTQTNSFRIIGLSQNIHTFQCC